MAVMRKGTLTRIPAAMLLAVLIAFGAMVALPLTSTPFAGDMPVFLATGRAALAGRNPYAVSAPFVMFGQKTVDATLDPPPSLLYLAPLSRLDLTTAIDVAAWLSLAMIVASIVALAWAHRDTATPLTILWALATGAVSMTILHREVYGLVFGFVAAGWLLLRVDRAVSAGICIGLAVAIKPNLGLWPALLFTAGKKRTAYAALASWLSVNALSLALFGPTVYPRWLAAVRRIAPDRI
ncbi:MAG TPA: glycosyltransferase family 87 protein [Chloroflexota bacterium]|nr:glycosyltransferase family 87 protein [Chloroflexota bacterium]